MISLAIESTALAGMSAVIAAGSASLLDLQGHKLWTEIQKSTHMNYTPRRETWAARVASALTGLRDHRAHFGLLLVQLRMFIAEPSMQQLRLDRYFAALLSREGQSALAYSFPTSTTSVAMRPHLRWSQADVTQE